ncbi:MAG: epoxyqueuosine reductase QueH [Nitrospinae bacterium]|nr:epoxyqueuosine reductase QueH [Nitrospinota bacterium]
MLQISTEFFTGKTATVYEGNNAEQTPSLLLHICCAPCSPYILQELKKNFSLSCFFYNPNIHPEEEYDFRYKELVALTEEYGLPLEKGSYNTKAWFALNGKLGNLPEKSERCDNCIQLRLETAAKKAQEEGFDFFSTVLSVSPHKDAEKINLMGKNLSTKYGIPFLYADFKKKNGFLNTLTLSKELNLQRQNYCGCTFSKMRTLEKMMTKV